MKKENKKNSTPAPIDQNPYISSKTIKRQLKEQGTSNSGGQFSYQTDNKQGTVNKGNQNPEVQGKRKAAKVPSKFKPKKK